MKRTQRANRGSVETIQSAVVEEDEAHDLPKVADRLHCSIATVRRRIDSGKLPAIKHGRIFRVLESDLRAFIQANRKWR